MLGSVYALVLATHSLLRWVVVGLGAAALIAALDGWARARPWSARDERIGAALTGAVDFQLVLGLAMWLGLSPLGGALFRGDRSAQGIFFGALHPIAMIVGLTALHAGRAIASKREGVARHRVIALALLAWATLLALAVPWPFMALGRPLLRAPF